MCGGGGWQAAYRWGWVERVEQLKIIDPREFSVDHGFEVNDAIKQTRMRR